MRWAGPAFGGVANLMQPLRVDEQVLSGHVQNGSLGRGEGGRGGGRETFNDRVSYMYLQSGGGVLWNSLILQEYLNDSQHPFLPLTRITQSQNSPEFEAAFDDRAAVS